MSEDLLSLKGYCSAFDFEKTLAQTLTTGSPNPDSLTRPAKLSTLGNKLNLTDSSGSSVGTYSLEDINYYCLQASSQIDAALSEHYRVPLIQQVKYTMKLTSSIDEYTDDINVSNPLVVNANDKIILTDHDNDTEEIYVDYVDGSTIVPKSPIFGIYSSSTTRVLVVKFPDPITFIAAKLACAMFYDKWARAQSEPMKTEFGDTLRKEAIAELNNIREGRTILHGAVRTGSRFVNSNLYSRYGIDSFISQDGTRSDTGRQ